MTDWTKDTRRIIHFRVVVHAVGERWPNSNLIENHWSIYLVIGDHTSVRINMRAVEYGDVEGLLEVTEHPYVVTNSCLKYWDFSPHPRLTVAMVYNELKKKGFDRYNMSGGGSGCRWWM
jgi:hypothetical protein